MIQRYKSFQTKQKLEELVFLLEGHVMYSNRFKEKLGNIKSKSKLAKFLFDFEVQYFEDDKVLKNNYVDTTDKEDKVTFISQVKFNQMQDRTNVDLDPYEVKGRNEIGVGRCVRSLAELGKFEFTDKELEEFVNLYKSKTDIKDEEFRLVSGDDIKFWYSEKNYYKDWGSGSLFNSCMRDVDSDYFDIYSNSDCCQLLILIRKDESDNELLIGRALIWKPTKMLTSIGKFTEAKYFMDRIYCSRDSDEQKFKNYAYEQGWLYKVHNNSNNEKGMMFYLKNEIVKIKIICYVDGNCDEYPYMDTLKFLNNDKDELSNIGYEDGYMLEDTDGECGQCSDCEGSGKGNCDNCDGRESVDCSDCNGTGSEYCDDCDGSGYINCNECDGNSNKDCSICNGDCEIDCECCNGSGEIEDDKGEVVDCVHCEGSGKKKCKKCNGSGEEECKYCDGSGREDCTRCDGCGTQDCPRCEGSGEVSCPECYGEGNGMCEECTGLIKRL